MSLDCRVVASSGKRENFTFRLRSDFRERLERLGERRDRKPGWLLDKLIELYLPMMEGGGDDSSSSSPMHDKPKPKPPGPAK